MKNLCMLLVTVGLGAAVAVAPLAAQTVPFVGSSLEVRFTASMPFYVGDKLMPAGTYEIRQQPGAQSNTLLVKGKGKNEAFVEFTPVNSDRQLPKMEVTFNKYGDKEYLNSINYPGDAENSGSWILKINPGAGEQAAAKTTAAAKHTLPGTK